MSVYGIIMESNFYKVCLRPRWGHRPLHVAWGLCAGTEKGTEKGDRLLFLDMTKKVIPQTSPSPRHLYLLRI